ncbi:SDR family oxidoreductase [Aeromonas veronii]|uniref:SDR family oxidoreductase n=1 Tax=Aeromonas veronii TaxID=654 RepID=UPI001BCF7832|nr:SDR family oxidoreductase [Aeromonas veronii]MBS4723818.1 SDR family oxidoreductase [Aeromonas veronii]MCF5854584.1 SDR family oxidoreductase [Aeromonas veronii]MCF5873575.1 SDR family oxidoreductase [Aeromonas veronii]
MNVLITGGNGDLAKYVSFRLSQLADYRVDTPLRAELDVTSPESVERYFTGHHFDVVVNCAGSLYSSLVVESDPVLWINDIQSNLIGSYLVTRMALKSNPQCRIVNIASTAAFNAYKDWTSYCAAKAGVIKLTQGLAKDGYNIVAICPGAIDTKLRGKLSINNPNVMSIEEGAGPIINSITTNEYNSGDIVFYRKGRIIINPEFIIDGV